MSMLLSYNKNIVPRPLLAKNTFSLNFDLDLLILFYLELNSLGLQKLVDLLKEMIW